MLFFLTITSVSDKSCRQNQNTHFMFNNFSFENRFFYKVKWKNMAHPDRSQMPTIEGYTHTQNTEYLLLLHGNNGFAKGSECCVMLHRFIYPHRLCHWFSNLFCSQHRIPNLQVHVGYSRILSFPSTSAAELVSCITYV